MTDISVADPGGGGGARSPCLVKNRPKTGGHQIWRLIFHVSWPPSLKLLDPLLHLHDQLTCLSRYGSRINVREGDKRNFANISPQSCISDENLGHKIGGRALQPPLVIY